MVYAGVASANLTGWAICLIRPAPPTRGVSRALTICAVSPPQSLCLNARHGDCKALGRRSADTPSVGGRSQGMSPPASIRSSEYVQRGESASLGRVPPMDGGLVPSQTYKDLVACADNTAVLPTTGADAERIPNHCRVGTLREEDRRLTVLKKGQSLTL